MSNKVVSFPVPAVTPPPLPVTVEDQTKNGVTVTQTGTVLVITDSNTPPVTTLLNSLRMVYPVKKLLTSLSASQSSPSCYP